MLREQVKTALTEAMKARDKPRTDALRLIQAAIRNRDIELRQEKPSADDDAQIIDVLRKMAKQRRESITMFEQGGRTELAAVEQAELDVIESFLPQQMSEADTKAAIQAAIAASGAQSVRDMGKVMAQLKEAHGATLDMAQASALVRAMLA